MGYWGKKNTKGQTETEGAIVKQVYNSNCMGKLISGEENDSNIKLQRYNTMNGIAYSNDIVQTVRQLTEN